jgi:hypothetical protein
MIVDKACRLCGECASAEEGRAGAACAQQRTHEKNGWLRVALRSPVGPQPESIRGSPVTNQHWAAVSLHRFVYIFALG